MKEIRTTYFTDFTMKYLRGLGISLEAETGFG